ncbi:MAG: phage antirepressor protein [Spirochaetes bacterium GWF1_31_7]|nr:MAG: phage antirepressor protein [Spirochaetes bacterium GWE1_32_154]OHD47819.1 MAG: phage antirepressor protein [Spirochaetes bacterium GWE2_31_10]OHD52547.1 MAG: phage antirepressor protein [Spirochaetes bacterium GWF1_31_7]OHD80750.1 MAG: phage antirepressor protein [Spirochaetes bacterium RIFOXYB1_FULL_32_8]HBD93422.1 phage antirepressor protein [Spirochaetia bacterium]
MKKQNTIQPFKDKKIRTLWDEKQEKWYISIVDVIAVLTESPNARKYWSVSRRDTEVAGF